MLTLDNPEIFFLQIFTFVTILCLLIAFIWLIKDKQHRIDNSILIAVMIVTMIGIGVDSVTYISTGAIKYYSDIISGIALNIIFALVGVYVYFLAKNRKKPALKVFFILTIVICIISCFFIFIDLNVSNIPFVYDLNFYVKSALEKIFIILCMEVISIGLIISERKLIDTNVLIVLVGYHILIICSALLNEITQCCLMYIITGVVIILFFIFKVQYYETLKQKIQETILRNHATEIKNQLEPEFLFNYLSAMMNDTNDKKEKKDLLCFSEYLRYNINAITGEDMVPYKDELRHLRIFITMQNNRIGEEAIILKYDLKTLDFMVPKYILQPIVREIIKMRRQNRAITLNDPLIIEIRTRKSDGYITALIESENISGYEKTKEIVKVNKIFKRIYNTSSTKKVSKDGHKMQLVVCFPLNGANQLSSSKENLNETSKIYTLI